MAQNAQDVTGIALDLTLDAGGFSSGINRAIADLERLRRAAQITIGVQNRGVTGAGGVTEAVGPRARATQPALAISPALGTSRQMVRDLRVDINDHFRQMATSGEAVIVPVKLGRIPYAAMRREIAAGIGEVPIRVRIENIGQLRSLVGGGQVGTGGGGGPVQARARGGFVRRGGGGPVGETPFQRRVREMRESVSQPTATAPRPPMPAQSYEPEWMKRAREKRLPPNVRHASGGATPVPRSGDATPVPRFGDRLPSTWEAHGHQIREASVRPILESYQRMGSIAAADPLARFSGNIWYPGRRRYLLEQAKALGALPQGKGFSPFLRAARSIIPVGAAASPGIADDMATRWALEIARVQNTPGAMRALAGQVGRGGPFYTEMQERIAKAAENTSRKLPVPKAVLALSAASTRNPAGFRLGAGRSGWGGIAQAWRIGAGQVDWRDAFKTSPKVGPFARNMYGNENLRTIDSHDLEIAGIPDNEIEIYRKIMGSTKAWPHGRPGAERAQLLEAARLAQEEYADIWRSQRRHQAGLWVPHFPIGRGKQPVDNALTGLITPKGYRGQEPEGWMTDPKTGIFRRRMAGGPVFRPVDAATFHSAVSSASQVVRPSGRRVGETVYTYPMEEYAHMRTFLDRGHTAGYAIKDDGDLVSVFNVGGRGMGKAALRSAIQRGATKLDAFDEAAPSFALGNVQPNDQQKNLPRFYSQFGFREVGRDPWNDEYAPPGWTGGRPDVVYMQRQRVRRRAGGGPIYATGELGAELFVPRSMESLIPPDVMARIPQRASGGMVELPRASSPAGNLWQAPEDGWIIPNHLMSQVPRAAAGATPPGPNPDFMNRPIEYLPTPRGTQISTNPNLSPDWQSLGQVFRTSMYQAILDVRARPGYEAAYQSVLSQSAPPRRRGVPSRNVADLVDLAERYQNERETARSLGPSPRERSLDLQTFTQSLAAQRGLTPRGGVAGGFQYYLGGGRERRNAMLDARRADFEYRNVTRGFADARGVDPREFLEDRLSRTRGLFRESMAARRGATDPREYARATAAARGFAREIHDTEEQLTEATKHQSDYTAATAKLNSGASGFLRNFAATQAAFVGYGVAMQGIATLTAAATPGIARAADELTGFVGSRQRVQGELAGQLPGAGTIRNLFGQVGLENRLSTGTTDFLQSRLGGGVAAVAAAQRQAQVSDLFRAAAGARGAPTGLYGGYGGVLGSGFLAEALGGGRGFSEIIGSDINALSGRVGANPIGNQLNDVLRFATDSSFRNNAVANDPNNPLLSIGKELTDPNSGWNPAQWGAWVRRRINGQPDPVTSIPGTASTGFMDAGGRFNPRAGADASRLGELTAYLTDLGDAAKRAAPFVKDAADVTFDFADSQQELNDAIEAARAAGDVEGEARARNTGVVMRVNGRTGVSPQTYQSALEQVAAGRNMPDPQQWMRAQEQMIRANRGVRETQFEDTIQRAIPAALGASFAQSGVSRVGAGITGAKGAFASFAEVPGAMRSMREVQGLQNDLITEARDGLRRQAAFIAENTSPQQAQQYTALMGTPGGGANLQTVSGIGQTIANINDALSDRAAAVNRVQYANQLRIINRSIGDALGILGRAGGSELGNIERQQYLLSRQSQALSLQANQLEIAMRQRQINFQVAIAGFQAPGITGQERAARRREAEIEAAYAQRQLNIDKSQQGIAQKQYGLSGAAYQIEATRSLTDLQAQRGILQQSFSLEQQQLAANKEIARLAQRQAQLSERATAIISRAEGNYAERLQLAGAYAAQFGGTIRAAMVAVSQGIRAWESALNGAQNRTTGGGTGGGGNKQFASGIVGDASYATDITVGEAGREKVVVVRNPRRGSGGSMTGGGGWGAGGGVINLGGVHVTVQGDVTDDALRTAARKAADMAIDEIGRKAGLFGLRVA